MYTSTSSRWPRYSVCRDSDTGCFGSRSGVAGVVEEDVSSNEDGGGDDPPGNQVDPPNDETDPPTDTNTEEQLPTSTAHKDGKVTSDDDTASPDGKTDASEPKRTLTTALGKSKGVTVERTAQKQGTHVDARLQVLLEREHISTSSQETDTKKGGTKDTSPPVADKQPDPKALPSNDEPCSKHVGTTDEKKPPIPHVEDTQDVVTVEDECAQAIVEGQQVQMVMAHMEPHDYESDLPFPIQESEQGRDEAAQLVLPHT